MTSTDRLAALSADLNAFMRLLGRTPRSELEPYRASIRSLAGDVNVHLASAAALVAALRATLGDVVSRDYLRAELRAFLDQLDDRRP